ncbi:MAG: hypothetical protein HY906_20375 [Deltaproteobacteria bacterium]|nr:hypothetical protein [Deltaproteobacteria bacterium]
MLRRSVLGVVLLAAYRCGGHGGPLGGDGGSPDGGRPHGRDDASPPLPDGSRGLSVGVGFHAVSAAFAHDPPPW